jgi:hypothetical protein
MSENEVEPRTIAVDMWPIEMGPMIATYVVTDEEAREVGLEFGGSANVWGDVIAPILHKKGCPKEATVVGNPYLQMKPRTFETGYTTFVLYEKAA